MCTPKNACKVFLARKFNKGKWKFRLSILENVNGEDKEIVFAKSADPSIFIEELKSAIHGKEIKKYEKIQRVSRYSLTHGMPIPGGKDVKAVPEYLFEEVREILKSAKETTVMKSSLNFA